MIVVTGASGYVGSHIVKRLVEIGRPVRALVRSRRLTEKEGRLEGLAVEWVEGDVTRPETLSLAMQGATAVIHTVAIAVEKGRHSYETINYQGTVNVVEAAKAAGLRRFINISQLGADSKLPYRFLASKGRAQEYVASSGLDWTAFRPSVIWGPEDEFANTFARLVPFSPIIYPIVGDVVCCKGRVTKTYLENGEHLVDMDVHCENQDGLVMMPGSATVRLPSRTDLTAY